MVRENNFDLLRLIAAVQVLLSHAGSHLGLSVPAFVSYFPGVPIFFVISGFLVSQSYERTALASYCVNRALRIFPGLWACLAVSIGIAAINGVPFTTAPGVGRWLLAQATVAQFYNPPFLREFGVGVLNGSLWTIPVELQFYIALPLIYAVLRSNRALILTIIAGAALNTVFAQMNSSDPSILQKLIGETLPIYLYLFLLGVLLQQNPGIVKGYLAGRLPLLLGAYLMVAVGGNAIGLSAGGNFLNPVQGLFLSLLIMSAAYAKPIPLRSDLSYGLYLYHMPVINAFVESGYSGYRAALAAAAITLALACASWFLIERPALGLKRHIRAPARPLPSTFPGYHP